jgi:hypothetical protein
MSEYRVMMELYWRKETESLRGVPVQMPKCPLQNPHGLTWQRTKASGVRSWRLKTYAVTRPLHAYYVVSVIGASVQFAGTKWELLEQRVRAVGHLCRTEQTSKQAHRTSSGSGENVVCLLPESFALTCTCSREIYVFTMVLSRFY